MSSLSLAQLNRLSVLSAGRHFHDCCASRAWVEKMTAGRPYRTRDEIFYSAYRTWWDLPTDSWIEAFRGHPPIGSGEPEQERSEIASQWSREEQAGAVKSEPRVLEALREANRQYHARFGYVFLIHATGKGAEEILEQCRRRMTNPPDTEVRVAAEEEARITRMRLEKMVAR